MFYNYSRFSDNALQGNLISIQNEQVIDRYANGIWQNPYQSEKVFAISPSIEFYQGKNVQVILPANLWQTNAAAEVSNISIDLNDGQGYRTLTVGQSITLNYADTGMKIWNYRLQLTSGQYLYSHSQVRIKNAIIETGCTNCRFGTSNPEVLPEFTADEAYLGVAGRGFITIRYRDADRGLRRPLIVVEGFDAGHITNPELQFGTSNINTFIDRNVLTSGSAVLENVLVNFPQYDIIYVDWRNGTDFLQRNGLLFQTIIRWVNNNKEPLPGGGFADNVILGQSMGGVITRWALRDMETRLGQQHHTRLFISMDAPQQGANVPASYQHLARHVRNLYLQTNVAGSIELFQWVTGGPSPFRVLSLADQPASRQMLINWVNGSGNIDNTLHDQWQTELRNLGYPTQNNIRNIAISNGAECGTTQPFSPGDEILNINGKANTRFLGDLLGRTAFPLVGFLLGQEWFYLGVLPGRNDIKYDFVAKAQPQQGISQQIYHGKISYTKSILWLIPVNVTISERNNNSNSSLLPYDYYAGGEINTGVNVSDINFQNALVKFNLNFSHIPTFSFVPTPSALDIGLNNITLTHADYLARYMGGTPPVTPRNTPFRNFVTAFNNERRNEQHIGFFQRNGDWLAEELTQAGNPPTNPPVANCSAFCENGAITGNPLLCTSEIYTAPFGNGVNYSWSVSNPALVTLNPIGNTVQLTRNGSASGQLTVTVSITGVCGVTTLSTQITVGVPSYNIIADVPCQPGRIVQVSYFTASPISPVATTYHWGAIQNGAYTAILGNGPSVSKKFPLGGPYVVTSWASNACGFGDETEVEFRVVSCSGGMLSSNTMLVYPNPSSSTLNVAVNEENEEATTIEIQTVEILDKVGQLRLKKQYSKGTKKVSFSVSQLPNDIHTLRVFDGKEWSSYQISIHH